MNKEEAIKIIKTLDCNTDIELKQAIETVFVASETLYMFKQELLNKKERYK